MKRGVIHLADGEVAGPSVVEADALALRLVDQWKLNLLAAEGAPNRLAGGTDP